MIPASQSPARLLHRLALTVLAFSIIALLAGHMAIAPALGWNDLRMAPAVYLANGLPIYGEAGLPGWTTLYGPAAIAPYLPAAWLGTSPVTTICLGTLCAWLCGFVALLLPAKSLLTDASPGLSRTARVTALLFMLGLWLILRSTGYALFDIHADGPAIAWLSVALWSLVRDKRWSAALTALGTVAAVFCKIIYLPGLVAAVVATLWLYGPRRALTLALWMQLFLILLLGVAHVLFGLPQLADAMLRVPAGHPWNLLSQFDVAYAKGTGSSLPWKLLCLAQVTTLAGTTWLLPLAALGAGWVLQPGNDKRNPPTKAQAWARALLCFTVFLAPGALVGYCKVGGDMNAWAAPVHFGLLLGLSLLVPHLPGLLQRVPRLSWVATVIVLVLSLRVAGMAGIHFMRRDATLYDRLAATMRAHPGEVWFHARPLAHWYFDHRASHSGDVLYCYELAQRSFDPAWLAAGLPPRFQYAAAYKFDPAGSNAPKIIDGATRTRLPELGESFTVFEKPAAKRQPGDTPAP